jgi:PAS domain S-box-containing protein
MVELPSVAINDTRISEIKYDINDQIYQILIDDSPLGIALFQNDNLIRVNNSFCLMFNYKSEQLPLYTIYDLKKLIYYKDRTNAGRRIRNFLLSKEQVLSINTRIFVKDSKIRWLVLTIKKFNYDNEAIIQVISMDVTEKKMSDEQILYSQRIETMGQLTAGVAHQLNTPLAVVSSRLQILESDLRKDGHIRYLDNLNKVIESNRNISNIITRLLTFLRQTQYTKDLTDINQLLNEITGLVKMSAKKKKIKIENIFSETLCVIPVYRNKLEQVFINIIINAFDAMPYGGTLKISTKLVHKDLSYFEICFLDTGTGMLKKVRENIFEPFYTTKSISKGSGLGMFKSLCFIKEHNGEIVVKSTKGKGTKVIIYLPFVQ